MTILEKVKVLSGITTIEHDLKIETVIEMMEDEIRNFCNFKESSIIPSRLQSILVQMAIDYLTMYPFGIKEFEVKNVKSVGRGDTSISYSYNKSSESMDMDKFIEGYHKKLIPFVSRKVIMR